MKACKQCVMDESDPSIELNAEGICHHCIDYKNRILFSDKEFREFNAYIQSAKEKKGEYNCIIGLSGGLDSTFLAIHAVKNLKLKPLAIHMDNGWNTGLAARNIKRTVEMLDLDLITEVLDWEEFKKMQLAIYEAGVPDLEAPTDLFINFTLRKYARKYGIDLVLSGSNPQTEGVMSNSWSYGQRDPVYVKALYERLWGVSPVKLPLMSLSTSLIQQLRKDYTVLRPLRFIDYGKDIAVSRCVDLVGWEEYERKHGESFITRFYQDVFLPFRFGVDKRRAHYSALILNGEMTREHALEKLSIEASPESLHADVSFLCMKLGISMRKYDEYMAQPIKSYRDYHSIHKTPVYRILKRLISKSGVSGALHKFLGDLLRR